MKEEIYKLEDRTATLKESIFSEENQGIKKSDSKFFVNFNRGLFFIFVIYLFEKKSGLLVAKYFFSTFENFH
jgi:hypothetical protein